MKTKRRLYILEALLTAGQEISLSSDQSHYLSGVLRLSSGDEVHLFNETHGEWAGEITNNKKQSIKIILKIQVRPVPAPSAMKLTLAFAPLKKDRTDFLVEKSSELGVHFLQPVFTDHTQSDRVNIERAQATAIEAAEQCDRLDAPQVLAAVKLQNYLQDLPDDALLFLAAESGDALPIAATVQNASTDIITHSHVHFLIGPEGGFSTAEFERFGRYPNIRRIRLGPRLLRAETAAVAVLSTFQAILGDWANVPDR